MKYFVLIILIVLSGCDNTILHYPQITKDYLDRNDKICENNNGIHRYHLGKLQNLNVYVVKGIVCNNGAIFIIKEGETNDRTK